MGTIVYGSLLRLLLDEGDFTTEEVIKIAHERYSFDEKYSGMEIRLQINMLKKYAIKELPDGKLQRIKEFPNSMESMTGGPESLPEGHFGRTNPKQRQFYIDLKERYGNDYPHKEREPCKISAPF